MAATPQFVAIPNVQGTTFGSADAGNRKDVFVAGSSGSRVEVVSFGSRKVQAGTIMLYFHDGTTPYIIARVLIPGKGTSAAAVTGALATPDTISWLPHTGGFPPLGPGQRLQAAMEQTLAGGETIDIVAWGGNF